MPARATRRIITTVIPRSTAIRGLVYEPVRPKGIIEKCTFCAQYRDKGELPACVQGCPGKARFVGDLDDASSEVGKMIKARDGFTLLPEKGAKSTVFYLPPKTKEV